MLQPLGQFVRRAALAMVLAASSLIIVTPASAQAIVAPAEGYGFGQGVAPVFYSFEDTNRELDAVTKTGGTWLRVAVDWSNIEGAKGQYNWSWLDNLVNAGASRNLRMLGVITYTPVWARPQALNSLLWTVPPANPQDFADFATAAVNRYGDRISHWEIWNEPNLPIFFGLVDRAPERYTELLKAVYPAIKAAQPNSTVVAAGFSPLNGDWSPPGFLSRIYAAGAKGYFDAAAAHPYVFPQGLAADPQNGWSDVGRMHDVMVANGDGGKKIWLTELGAPTGTTADSVSQEEQAKQILDVLAAAAATGYCGPAFIYSIRDVNTADPGNRENTLGSLLTSDWKPKYTAGVLAR